jgi:hypothetical protein
MMTLPTPSSGSQTKTDPFPASPGVRRRRDILLAREVEACEDPVCCCEAEPRWLRFRDLQEGRREPTEWESLDRAPNEEL